MRNKASFFVMPLIFLFFLAGCQTAGAGASSAQHNRLGIRFGTTGYLDADIENQWNGYVDGKYLEVYAGVRMKNVDPTNQGQLIVQHELPEGSNEAANDSYFAPGKHGWVKITAENKGVLTLLSEDGTTYHFDLHTRAYIEGN